MVVYLGKVGITAFKNKCFLYTTEILFFKKWL